MRFIKIDISLIIWIVSLIVLGGGIGSLTKPEINSWYSTLNRSPLTPPNYIFPIAWTILYGIIGACGWIIWRNSYFPKLKMLKVLYLIQLILNWSWAPLFFLHHLSGLALIVLISMNILVGIIILLAYSKIRLLSVLMIPYLFWILFASYLNLYIWLHN